MKPIRTFLNMYSDGFRNLSPLARTLWVIVAIKLAIIFLVIKLLFFPNILNKNYSSDAQRAEAVRNNLTN